MEEAFKILAAVPGFDARSWRVRVSPGVPWDQLTGRPRLGLIFSGISIWGLLAYLPIMVNWLTCDKGE